MTTVQKKWLVPEGGVADAMAVRIVCGRHANPGENVALVSSSRCPHCAADYEILEQRIDEVVFAVGSLQRDAPRVEDGEVLRDALRSLVAEVRRR